MLSGARRYRVVLWGMLGAVSAGCSAPGAATEPSEIVLRVVDYERFVEETLTMLRENDLPPARVDRAAGRIETRPTTSGQWFELWRIDSPGGYQSLESSLHTIQRRVTIRIERASNGESAVVGKSASATEGVEEDGGKKGSGEEGEGGGVASGVAASGTMTARVSVEVEKTRYNAPERQVTTSSGALAIYSERIPTTEGLFKARDASERWIPLGRDGLMEAVLLERMARLPAVEAE